MNRSINNTTEPDGFESAEPDYRNQDGGFTTAREKFLGLSLESTRKSYYPELKKQLEVARELADKYRQLVEFAPAGIYEIDVESMKFISVNDLMCTYTGYSRDEFLALDPRDIFDNTSRPARDRMLEEALQGNLAPPPAEYQLQRKDGKPFPGLVNSRFYIEDERPRRATEVIHDLTAIRDAERVKKNLEAQLHHARKMESIGNLAGGIAHDFNNILSSIIGFTELALDDLDDQSPVVDHLQEVYASSKRAMELVRQILAFARQSEETLKPIRVDEVIEEVLGFIRSSIPTTIGITRHIHSSPVIMGNQTQIHQIMMNLCTNAAHAMEEEGGELRVSLQNINLARDAEPKVNLNPGTYLELKVSDTGTGIDPDIAEKIFEPYFTTKKTGKGTGLGLAMVHGIIESYGGKIDVHSKRGVGTTFTIYLPVLEQQQSETNGHARSVPTGTERILFVDDEAPIARMSGHNLSRLGYTVTTRTSSVEALELFKARPDYFDLVITDMNMPNLSGDHLAREMMQIRKDIRIVLCTGYSNNISSEAASEIGIKAFAYKPLIKADLARIIRSVLDDDQI